MDTDIAHLAELETIKAQFEELRFNIEEQERAWKGSIIERRQIVPRVFTSQESEFLAIQESDIASKARQELIRVKALQMVQVTTKAKDESHIAAELTMRIAESKAKFVRQGSFIEAGPKFLRHGFCLFGRVLHLSVIVEECFAVFSEQNTAELWHMPAQGEETLAEVVQIIAAGVTFVAEMSNTYYPDPTHKGKIAPDPPKTSTDNYAMRNTISLEWFKNAAATYTVMGIPAECPPLTRKVTYFIGCESGYALTLDIFVTWDPATQGMTRISYDAITCASLCTDGNIVTEIKTSSGVRLIQAFSPSLQPEWGLKCMTLNQLVKDHQTRMILGKEFELQLERGPADSREERLLTCFAWDSYHQCLLIGTQTAVIRLFYSKEEISESHTNLAFIKLMWALEIQSPEATDTFESKDTASGEPESGADMKGKPPSKNNRPEKTKTPTDQKSKAPGGQGRREKVQRLPDDDRPPITSISYSLQPVRNRPKLYVCGDDGVIRLYPDESFKCPTVPAYFYLDRELRIDIEQAKKVDLHDPTSHSLEQSAIAQRVDLHSMANVLLLPELGIQYVVSFNDNAMLIIYDPSDPEMVIEIQIHSQGGSPDRQKRGRAFYGEPNVKILDDSSGLCVLSINKQWSLFTLDALVKWGVKDKATPGSLAAA